MMWKASKEIRTEVPRVSKVLRASTVMNGPITRIVSLIRTEANRKKYDKHHKDISMTFKNNESSNCFSCSESLFVPVENEIANHLPSSVTSLPKVPMKFKCFEYSEDSFSHFIIKKSEKRNWDECFIILPFVNNPEKCLVYFISSFKSGITELEGKPMN